MADTWECGSIPGPVGAGLGVRSAEPPRLGICLALERASYFQAHSSERYTGSWAPFPRPVHVNSCSISLVVIAVSTLRLWKLRHRDIK